jgi:hypothetical protein
MTAQTLLYLLALAWVGVAFIVMGGGVLDGSKAAGPVVFMAVWLVIEVVILYAAAFVA